MSQAAIEAIRKLALSDETIETSGFCDAAVAKMILAARSVDPNVKIFVLEHPNPVGAIHHKALLIEDTVVNLSATGLYPRFIGPLETAPVTFRNMVKINI